jgi:flavin reductase (DIM6/NTAB) family NADH-FMN oxidoreductase RutF
MRSSAQPVTVVSTRLSDAHHSLHGATLSSFSSIALHPLPLVAFSLRQPSRLADALHTNRLADPDAVHGVVNILAAHQSELAVRFSRPDLYPEPFNSATYRLENSFPVFEDTVGALSFSVLTSLALQNLGLSGVLPKQESALSSKLFIARVTRILTAESDLGKPRKPLVYYQGSYASVAPTDE